MLDFFVLGTLDIVRRAEPGAPPIRLRAKQTAFLARLVLYQPRGWQRRGSLLATFWPESDERRARFSLRNALHGLRSDLGNDAILSRGDDELMVNPDFLSCDALLFEDAIAEGRLEDALALYRGPLLEGLIVAGAADFHIWIDERREGLRRRAVSAAVTLADRATAGNDCSAAIAWNRRAMELSPHDEMHVRRLLKQLDDRGDRAGALLLYEQWATRLRAELESDPSPETIALANSLRATSPQPVRRPPPPAPTVQPPAISNTPPRRRTPAVAIGAIAATVLVVGTIVALRVGRTDQSSARSDGTAVLPFAYSGDPQYASTASATAALVSSGFGETGPLHSVDPRAVATLIDAASSNESPVSRGAAAAHALGANSFVVGSVSADRGTAHLEASIFDLTHTDPIARATAVGPIDSLSAIAQRLAFDLIAARVGGVSVASLGKTSDEALRAYFDGERQMFAARYAGAVDAYSRAVAADSQFARAYLRLAYASSMGGQDALVGKAADRAAALSSRLMPNDRTLLLAWRAARDRDIPKSVALYENALSQDERNPEAWLQLADIRFHWGPSIGIPAASAAQGFRRVVAMVPSNAAALIHLARIDVRDAPNGGGFDTLARAARALDLTANEDLELRLLGAIRSGNARDRAAVIADAASRGGVTERLMLIAAVPFADTVVSTALARNLTRNGHQADLRIPGFFQLAQIAASHGRMSQAREIQRQIAAFAPARALELHAWLLLLPYGKPSATEARAVADSIATIVASGDGNAVTLEIGTGSPALFSPDARYLEGALALIAGDTTRANTAAKDLSHWSAGTVRTVAVSLAGALREELAMYRGPSTAIRAFGPPHIPATNQYPDLDAFAMLRERFLRAEALLAAGRTSEALAWYETFPDPMGSDVWFLPAALQRRAMLYQQAGRTDDARLARERFVAFWQGADPEVATFSPAPIIAAR